MSTTWDAALNVLYSGLYTVTPRTVVGCVEAMAAANSRTPSLVLTQARRAPGACAFERIDAAPRNGRRDATSMSGMSFSLPVH
jgi:hypothetical protein